MPDSNEPPVEEHTQDPAAPDQRQQADSEQQPAKDDHPAHPTREHQAQQNRETESPG